MAAEKKQGRVREVLSDYWAHTKRYPLLVSALFATGALIQAAVIAAPLYLKRFVDIIAGVFIGGSNDAVFVLAMFGAFSFVAWGLRRVQFYFVANIESLVIADLYRSSFAYMLDHSYHFFISNFVGSLVRRITRYAKSYEVIVDAIAFQLYPVTLLTIGIVIVLYMRHPLLGLGLLLWTALFVTFQITLIRVVHPYRLRAAEEDSRVTGILSDALSNQSTVALFSGGAFERGTFSDAVERMRAAMYRAWKFDDNVWAIQGFLIVSVNVALLFVALNLWQKGLLTVGDFVLIQTYLLTLFERLVQAGREMRHIFSAVAEATEMAEVLRLPHNVRDNPGAKALKVTHGEIAFEHVEFRYHEGNPALNDFTISIKGAERVAFVGPSGAGKTTITKLLLRLYDVSGGKILIDGVDIAGVTLESLREAISFVPQDPVLFHRTLLENIRYGKRDATEAQVIEAAKKAHCHEFISALPKRYQTYVGERGVKLSGGERQRIAIARAILKNAPILVLDEATSSLDSESEALIQDALETLMKGKTVIVIAHRLSTVMKMDRIIVMEEGRATAEGTHGDLIAQGGRYQTLWNIQAGGFRESEQLDRDEVEGA